MESVSFVALAECELNDAAQYYDAKRDGLGRRFIDEVRHSVRELIEFPEAGVVLQRNVRRVRLKAFPYGILYEIRNDRITVLAIMHMHRQPFYWTSRVRR